MVVREHRESVRADLVGGVAVRGDAVGAGDHAVDLTARHQRGSGRVDDHRMRDARLLELPRGQARTLEQRARLVDPDVIEQATLVRCDERADGAAVSARREAACVAMRQRACAGGQEVGGVRRHPAAALDLVGVQLSRVLVRRLVLHHIERPREIDRRRPRAAQHFVRRDRILAVRNGERVAVGGRDADCRRAAHDHRANGVGDLGSVAAAHLDLLERQPALVEEDDGIVLEPDDPLRSEQRPAARRTWACARAGRG